MFILELTLRAWHNSEECKRRTLQRNDIAAAITKTDIFDFLVDIVPRDERVEAMDAPRGAPMPTAGAFASLTSHTSGLPIAAHSTRTCIHIHVLASTGGGPAPAGMYFAQPGMVPGGAEALMHSSMPGGFDPTQMMFPYPAMMPPPGWPPMPGTHAAVVENMQ